MSVRPNTPAVVDAERDIRDFGVQGDGTTDDTAALERALEYAGDLYIPGLEYRVAGAGANAGGVDATLTRSLRVRCAPGARFVADGLDNDMIVLRLPADTRVEWYGGTFDQTNQKNSTVIPDSGTWPGGGAAGVGTSDTADALSIRMVDDSAVSDRSALVDGVRFVAGDHWETAGGDSGLFSEVPTEVRGCTFVAQRDLGAYLSFDDTGRVGGAFYVHDNRFINCYHAVSVKRGADRFSIHDNDFDNCVRAILVNAVPQTAVVLATSAAADDIIDTATDHGFSAGDEVRFVTLTGGTGLSTGQVYYVLSASLAARTFKVSESRGGTAVDFGADITAGTVTLAGRFLGGSIARNQGRSCREAVFIQTADYIVIDHNLFFDAGSYEADGTTPTGLAIGVKVSGSKHCLVHDNRFPGVNAEHRAAYPLTNLMLYAHTYTGDGTVTPEDVTFRHNEGTGWAKRATDDGTNTWVGNSCDDAAVASTVDEQEVPLEWTPTLAFATPGDSSIVLSTATGFYRRHGDRIDFSFRIVTSTFTHTTAAGNLRIGGLPETVDGDSNHVIGQLLMHGWTEAGYSALGLVAIDGTTRLEIKAMGSGVSLSDVAAADLPTGTGKVLLGWGTYQVAP